MCKTKSYISFFVPILIWGFLVSLFECKGSFQKENPNARLMHSDYGYFKFKSSLYDGGLSIQTKLFQNPEKCFSDYDCNPEGHWTEESGLLDRNRQNFPIPLDLGSYYAISRVRYFESSFFDCKSSELKIYHGFRFQEPFDPFHPLDFYHKDQCEWISENSAVCPRIDITKKGILEIDLRKGSTRNSHISLWHLLYGPSGLGLVFSLTYCGPVMESLDFIDLQVHRYE